MSPQPTPKRRAAAAPQTYSLKEVAAQVGVDLRVLRSWMELPYRILVGFGRGYGKRYPQAFLDRAMLVQRLRAENLPLAEVASRLRAVSDEDLAALAGAHAGLVPDPALAERIYGEIRAEWERTKAAVLSITGHDDLLGGQPELDRLIRQRMPYVEPLNHVQIELIRRRRAGDDDPRVRNGILLAINGVAAGLRNSG